MPTMGETRAFRLRTRLDLTKAILETDPSDRVGAANLRRLLNEATLALGDARMERIVLAANVERGKNDLQEITEPVQEDNHE